MQISPISSPFFSTGLSIKPLVPAVQTATSLNAGPSLRDFGRLVLDFEDAQRSLSLASRSRTLSQSQSGQALSRDLGLSNEPVSTVLRSLSELNRVTTSFGPRSPDFAGGSTSEVTISGQYSGANGDDTLTFEAITGGVLGQNAVAFQVTDAAGDLVDEFVVNPGQADDAVSLSNGLRVEFSDGNVIAGDSFQVNVFSSIGSAPNPDNPFNGTGDQDPLFSPGISVGAGSFVINEVTIEIAEDDSLNSVLERITSSDAGVTAFFNSNIERVVLVQDTPGPGQDIRLGLDTSGFLGATLLFNENVVRGAIDQSNVVIESVNSLNGIFSGSFRVNGEDVSIDIESDSLADVLQRVNDLGVGVTASLNPASGRVSFTADGSDSFTLEDGDSNFLTRLDIDEGTFTRSNSPGRASLENRGAFQERLVEFVQAYERLFEQDFQGLAVGTVASIRSSIEAQVTGAFEDFLGESGSRTLRSGLGLDFVLGSNGHRVLEIDQRSLGRNLDQDAAGLVDLLFADREGDRRAGFVTGLGLSLIHI